MSIIGCFIIVDRLLIILLNNAVINISTPLLPIYKEGYENTFCISGKDEEALHKIIEKAKAYINGETRTKQMKLVVDNTEEK